MRTRPRSKITALCMASLSRYRTARRSGRPIPQSAVRKRTLRPLGPLQLGGGTDCASAAYDDVRGGIGVAIDNSHDNSIPMKELHESSVVARSEEHTSELQ